MPKVMYVAGDMKHCIPWILLLILCTGLSAADENQPDRERFDRQIFYEQQLPTFGTAIAAALPCTIGSHVTAGASAAAACNSGDTTLYDACAHLSTLISAYIYTVATEPSVHTLQGPKRYVIGPIALIAGYLAAFFTMKHYRR